MGPRHISTRPGASACACRLILSKSLPIPRARANTTALGTGKKLLGSRLSRSYGVLVLKIDGDGVFGVTALRLPVAATPLEMLPGPQDAMWQDHADACLLVLRYRSMTRLKNSVATSWCGCLSSAGPDSVVVLAEVYQFLADDIGAACCRSAKADSQQWHRRAARR